jgi:hypothetical protein
MRVDRNAQLRLGGSAGAGLLGGDFRVSQRVLVSRRSITVSRSKTSRAR